MKYYSQNKARLQKWTPQNWNLLKVRLRKWTLQNPDPLKTGMEKWILQNPNFLKARSYYLSQDARLSILKAQLSRMNTVLGNIVQGILVPGRWVTLALFVISFSVAGLLHGINMLHYPYYEGDEGTYMSQAWSVVEKGELAPYTYWYDHAPAGWYAIAGFIQLIGGDFFLFGTSLDTGRVFMLIVHLASAALIFFILQRLARNAWISAAGVILFSISPLEIYFQRRILLDNIMIFWVLAAIAIQLARKEHIWNFVLSGLFLGLAMLTKITAIIFFVPLLLAVYFGKHRVTLSFRSILFLAAFGLTYSVYLLYAFIKDELLPNGLTVSFVSAFQFQMTRGGGGVPFWDEQSMFMQIFRDWILKDEMYMSVAAGVMILALVVMPFRKSLQLFMLGSMLYVLFLARGGVVLNFYVLPVFPMVAIVGGLALSVVAGFFRGHAERVSGVLGIVAIVGIIFTFVTHVDNRVFVLDETSQQRRVIHWIKDNLKEDQVIIADNFALVDLWDARYYNGKSFKNADWFYKVENDPEIRDIKYNGDWRNFDYLLVNHEMLRQIERKESPILQQALINSSPLAKWLPVGQETFVDEQRFISTNGDWTMIYAINNDTKVTLSEAWNRYKRVFMQSYGQVVDLDTNITTSEGQSYAMLQAAWMNDKDAFKGAWLWAKHHFQNRVDDKLFSWKWENDELNDSTNASDADQDIALALLFGYRMFGEDEYLDAAKEIIRDIWRQEVREINGRLYMLPMNYGSAMQPDGLLFNPSYLSPAWYRIFQEVDPEHDWDRLADDSYLTLNQIARQSSNMPLPANWYVVDERTGVLTPALQPFGAYASEFSYDAFRILWRVGMDWEWFDSPEAKSYLERVSPLLANIYERNDDLPASISAAGQPKLWEESTAVDAGYLSVLRFAKNKDIEKDFYEKFFQQKFNADQKTWGSGNYYDSSWAWLGAGLYNRDLFNLWKIRLFQ